MKQCPAIGSLRAEMGHRAAGAGTVRRERRPGRCTRSPLVASQSRMPLLGNGPVPCLVQRAAVTTTQQPRPVSGPAPGAKRLRGRPLVTATALSAAALSTTCPGLTSAEVRYLATGKLRRPGCRSPVPRPYPPPPRPGTMPRAVPAVASPARQPRPLRRTQNPRVPRPPARSP